jgi:pimeloyl-ACP methyl ester carboxylesterase
MTEDTSSDDERRPPALHVGGQGPALVLLHGLGGTWEVWKPVLAALEARHRVIALTLPGHFGGPALAQAGDATVAGMADQVVSTLRAEGIEQAHVAGNSLGGWLSIELARRGFARSVVAFSPAGGWRNEADYRAIATPFRVFYAVVGVVLFLVTWLARFAWLRRALTAQAMAHGERQSPQAFLEALRGMSHTRILPGLLRSMARDGPIAPLDTTVPVTIAWGEHDRVIPHARYGTRFRDCIPNLREAVVADAGHVPMWDNPQQVVEHILCVTAAVDHGSAVVDATREAA